MKRYILLFSVVTIIMGLVFAVPAFAGKPAPTPKHEIIVSKDGDGDFTTISDAVSSITDASPTNRYLIKVEPGVYNESVTLSGYIDLEGSGQTNTVITSMVNSDDCWQGVSAATVVIQGDTSIKNIKVINTTNDANGMAVLFKDAKSHAEGIVAEATGISSIYNFGICVVASVSSSSDVILHHVSALGENAAIENHGIRVGNNSHATIFDSQFTSIGGRDWSVGVGAYGGTIDIHSSISKASGSNYPEGMDTHRSGSTINAYDVVVQATDGLSSTRAISGTGITVINSEISATSSVGQVYALGSGRVASSMIEGPVGLNPVVNCWDENFNPIPNQ